MRAAATVGALGVVRALGVLNGESSSGLWMSARAVAIQLGSDREVCSRSCRVAANAESVIAEMSLSGWGGRQHALDGGAA